MTRLPEGSELPLKEISPEARALAETLHHEARTERIFSILELALRQERTWMLESIRSSIRGYPNLGGDSDIMQNIESIEKTAFVKGYIAGKESITGKRDFVTDNAK